jgi:hypothetical protein
MMSFLFNKNEWRTIALNLITRRSMAHNDENSAYILYRVYARLSDEKRYELYKLVVKQREPLMHALNVVER